MLSPRLEIHRWEEEEDNTEKSDICELSPSSYFDLFVFFCMFQATTSTNWILESQNINELKSEIYSLKGLLLNRYGWNM